MIRMDHELKHGGLPVKVQAPSILRHSIAREIRTIQHQRIAQPCGADQL